jgi:hypothetical protein
MKLGVYMNMTMDEYLALPALSSGVVRAIVDRCPAAAFWQSPLNPDREPEDTSGTDRGTIAHGILLEGSTSRVSVIDPAMHPAKGSGSIPEGWTNASIRAARDAARANGLVPVLQPAMAEITRMVNAARSFIESLRETEPHIVAAFEKGGGDSEMTIVWEEDGVRCKARFDRLSTDRSVAIDYKTSAMSVEPHQWARRQLTGMGYNVTAAWYRRAIKAAFGVDCAYHFLNQEAEPPYLCSLTACDPMGLSIGADKIRVGLAKWQECVRTGRWPGYPNHCVIPETPQWEENQWMERQGIECDEQGIPYDPAKLFQQD